MRLSGRRSKANDSHAATMVQTAGLIEWCQFTQRRCQLKHNNVSFRAVNDGEKFGSFSRWYLEFIKGLPEIIEERLPLLVGDLKVRMGIAHGSARVSLRASAGFTYLLGYQILEPGP